MDPVTALHAAGLNNEVDPVLAGAVEAMAVGPQTDASERQVFVPENGQVATGFEPVGGATVQPSMVVGAIASCESAEHAVMYPIGSPYFGLPAPASGAVPVDGRSVPRREQGPFEVPRSPRQRAERVPTSVWAGSVPTTVSAQTVTTTMVTSTVATFAAVAGPAYVLYAGFMLHRGLTSVHPVQPAVVLQSVELSGSFPGA